MRLEEYFPPERLVGMAAYMKDFAARFGIYDFTTRDRIPNTRRALALAEVAREEGKVDALRTRAMDAHWRDGLDLENDEHLAIIARDAGLPDDAVSRSKSDPRYLTAVDQLRTEANFFGIRGIPTFVLGRGVVTGCQPYEILEDFARTAGAVKR